MTDIEIQQRITAVYTSQKQEAFPASISKTSFGNARKYYRFMDRIELEFGICFSYDDLDKTYSIEALTQKAGERMGKKKSNMMLLKQRLEKKDRYIFEIFLAALAVSLFTWKGITWVSISIAIMVAVIIYWLVTIKLYNNRHNKKLQQKIGAAT